MLNIGEQFDSRDKFSLNGFKIVIYAATELSTFCQNYTQVFPDLHDSCVPTIEENPGIQNLCYSFGFIAPNFN
jgi:hypothetical protein